MKDKEFVFNIDTLMELSTRIRCLGELSDFAVDQLNFYQEKNKDKGAIDLLEILHSDESRREEIRDVYMERHYRGFCRYLQECLNATREELKKLRPKLGSGEEKSAQSHQKRTLKC